jgi:hypothetical protein
MGRPDAVKILECDACGYSRSTNDDGMMFVEDEVLPDVLFCSDCWEGKAVFTPSHPDAD